MIDSVLRDLKSLADEDKRIIYQRFFKTGKGEYGEGDVFWGVTVPLLQGVAKEFYKDISLDDVESLLHNSVHEVRLCALHMLVYKYSKGNGNIKKVIVDLYLSNLDFVNNWDLVDSSSYKILGDYVYNHPECKDVLYSLAQSHDLWKQRVAVISSLALIRNNEFEDIIKLSKMLLRHEHDLMHKAVGWMLREMGKRDEKLLKVFLDKYVKDMPRTMLRYAIEKLDERDRKRYLSM